jgi:hypothetical protein
MITIYYDENHNIIILRQPYSPCNQPFFAATTQKGNSKSHRCCERIDPVSVGHNVGDF